VLKAEIGVTSLLELKSEGLVGVGEAVGVGVDEAVGVGVDEAVGVGVDEAVGVGVDEGVGFAIATPLSQISFLPLLIHVYFLNK
jgi:hypothetical protein